MDGELLHHIFFTEKQGSSTMIWERPMNNEDHAKPGFGKL
jgi:hypothetical protein